MSSNGGAYLHLGRPQGVVVPPPGRPVHAHAVRRAVVQPVEVRLETPVVPPAAVAEHGAAVARLLVVVGVQRAELLGPLVRQRVGCAAGNDRELYMWVTQFR